MTGLADYDCAMGEQRSRLQLLDELQRLDYRHSEATVILHTAAASPSASLAQLCERYSYGELEVIADFLAADTERLRAEAAAPAHRD